MKKMSELEIHGKKEKLQRLKKHLEKEHPSTKGKMEIETEKEKKYRCKGTIWTGEF